MNRIRFAVLAAGVAALLWWAGVNAEPAGAVPAAGVIPVVNVVDYGAAPDDGKDDTAAVASAIAACLKNKTRTLCFPGGTFNLAGTTFPEAVQVFVADGALLEIAAGATLSFNGPFTAGLYRVFSGSGKVDFGSAAVAEVYPQWWYSSGDASVAVNQAIASAPRASGLTVRLVGTLNCQTTITVNRDRLNLVGSGIYATQLVFNPAAPLPLIEFAKPDKSMIVQCSIRDLGLLGAGEWMAANRTQKIGIRIVDADIIEVRNIAIQNWTGNHSIGLQIRGRDFGTIDNISVVADLPISIEKNPNLDWISIDHFNFHNQYLITTEKDGMAVRIASGTFLTNVVFDGTNSWCVGKYGLYWEDTESKGVSSNLSVKNVRMEQGSAPGGQIIHIAHNYGLHNLVLENIYGCSGGVGGIYLRKCGPVTMQNIFYTTVDTPTPTALDIDESCWGLALINALWNAGTIKTGKLVQTFATNTSAGASRTRTIEVYDPADSPQRPGLIVYGVETLCEKARVAANSAYYLTTVGTGVPAKVATVILSASSGSGVNAGGTFLVGDRGATVVLVSGTGNLATTPIQGKLCLVPGNQTQLMNYLGADLDVVITTYLSR